MGGKKFQTGLHICQSTISDTGKLLCTPIRRWMDLCSPLSLRHSCTGLHPPCRSPGRGTGGRHSPVLWPPVPTSYPALELLKCGAACLLLLLAGQQYLWQG